MTGPSPRLASERSGAECAECDRAAVGKSGAQTFERHKGGGRTCARREDEWKPHVGRPPRTFGPCRPNARSAGRRLVRRPDVWRGVCKRAALA